MKTKIKNKKIYSKPLLEVIAVDYEISMAMETGPPGGPGDTGNPNPPIIPDGKSLQQGPSQLSTTSADNDPFGGSAPQY